MAIAFGSNLGDSSGTIIKAASRVAELVTHFQLAPLYATSPMYVENQPEFVNTVGIGNTDLSPRALLAHLKQIEQELGRVPTEPNGPRIIDIDLLTYGALRYSWHCDGDRALVIPHPRMHERRFVLVPLSDLDGGFVIPGVGNIGDLLHGDFAGQELRKLDFVG